MCSLVVVPIESTKMSEAESPKTGSSKAGSSKAGSPKAGSPKAGSSKAGSFKAGSSKAGLSKAETSKTVSSKAESSTEYWSFADESVVREIQYMDSIPEVKHHYHISKCTSNALLYITDKKYVV